MQQFCGLGRGFLLWMDVYKTYPSLSRRLKSHRVRWIFRPTWPMYMKFVEIICDVDRKKAHTHPTRHLTINGNKCWWPKSGTGWCGCVFQISLGDAYLRRARFHPSRVSLCPTLSSTTFIFWCQNHESLFAHARNGTPLNKLMLPFTTYRCQHGYGHGVLNAGWWFETFSFLPHTWQRWSNLTFAYFSDGVKPPTRL